MSRLRPRHVVPIRLGDLTDLIGAPIADRIGHIGVTGISLSSTRIEPGDLYAALAGTRVHGARFAADALAAGAHAILTDAEGSRLIADSAPVLEVSQPRSVLGQVAARIYGHPSEHLQMIGVTGTQGKTTTTQLLESALSAAGVPAGVVGTVGTRIRGVGVKTALTTPEAPDLQGLLAVMREEDVVACAMEVSSHAIVLGRVDGVVFDVAAFTNLGRDHLDFHATVDDYFEAKAELFTPSRSRRGLVNIDDDHGRLLMRRAAIPMTSFSLVDPAATWHATALEEEPGRTRFRVHGPGGIEVTTAVNIPGRYNVSNALCALALGCEVGFDPEDLARGLTTVAGVPGRLERIVDQDVSAPTVYVDFAHKPDAVTAALRAVRPLAQGSLVIVLGAGGDRDSGKRALMGAAAAQLADRVIVTDDNPRSEDPAQIRAAVAAGARAVGRAQVQQIADRREAIREAIMTAGVNDVVVLAGKGHETGQEIAGIVYPFDDVDEARAALRLRREL